jgi:hypothetical protein
LLTETLHARLTSLQTCSSIATQNLDLQRLHAQEIIALVEAYSWAQLKWAQLTKVGSDSSKV